MGDSGLGHFGTSPPCRNLLRDPTRPLRQGNHHVRDERTVFLKVVANCRAIAVTALPKYPRVDSNPTRIHRRSHDALPLRTPVGSQRPQHLCNGTRQKR
jgi:hypothetical protein